MTEAEFKKRYIKARRTIIGRDFSKLNDKQQKAVMTTQGPLLLLAGAGSGKTTVLINRIANILRYGSGSDSDKLPEGVGEKELMLLEEAANSENQPVAEQVRSLCAVDPCEPWRIIAITFTNKAAGELKARLERMLGSSAQDIWAQTFHSACVRILRRNADKLGYSKSFTIYDSSDSQSVVKHIIKDMELDEKTFPYKTVLSYISQAKDNMVAPEQFLSQAVAAGDIRRRRIGEIYDAYKKRLTAADAMDFDDLIYNTVVLLEEHEDVRDYYRRLFRYVMIDEYQDTNNLQYRLASALTGGKQNICVVGDDDQSIYKFRGATIENILSFESCFKNAKVIRLEQNYRSTGNILEAANAVIRNNVERKGKELWTDQGAGEQLTLYVAQDENDEARYVAAGILEGMAKGTLWRENAVLYRMNAQSNKLEYAFKRNGIPYRIVGGTRFFDRLEIKDMMAYLSTILLPNDDLRLSRIINSPARGIGARTVEQAQELAKANGVSLYEIIKNAQNYPELSRSSVKLREFTFMMDGFRQAASELPLDQLFDLVVEKTGYIRALEEKPSDENTARIENVNELKTNILSYIDDTGDTGLAGFLDEVALYTDLDSLDGENDSVVMMTMHAAKGLEFENVYIVGVEEEIFPGIRCIGFPEEMEEERRLCYVGLTRAKKRLTLTCARQRMLFGKTSANKPSRFVEEIPEEYLCKIEPRPAYDFERSTVQKRTQAYSVAAYTEKPKPKPFASQQAAENVGTFKTGDSVNHKAFGDGIIMKMTPMGGDYLVEIAFKEGTKRLMLRAAAQHMTKA